MVFLVHGWRIEGNFSRSGLATFGILPELLTKEFNCNCSGFNYPTGLKTQTSLLEVSQSLRREIADCLFNLILPPVQNEFEPIPIEFDPNSIDLNLVKIAIVAHSLGGVVARKALTLLVEEEIFGLSKFIKLVVLIASPASSADLIQLAQWLLNVLQGANLGLQLSEFITGSEFIEGLNQAWKQWLQDNPHCLFRCINGSRDPLVTLDDGRILDTGYILLDYDHTEIKNVHDAQHPLFSELEKLLVSAGFSLRSSGNISLSP
uniref:DUF676 domain-containing protein n=1 Tax=Cyanothece sp. (strain PCC 7425 / ATCC 29141) TaxID=395961 RepID=B8HWN0_CYAP4